MPGPAKPRVFVDADVLFAGAASPTEHGASLIVLRLGEITLIEALTSEQVIREAEYALEEKLPHALPAFRLLVRRALRVVPDPAPEELRAYEGLAEPVRRTAWRKGFYPQGPSTVKARCGGLFCCAYREQSGSPSG